MVEKKPLTTVCLLILLGAFYTYKIHYTERCMTSYNFSEVVFLKYKKPTKKTRLCAIIAKLHVCIQLLNIVQLVLYNIYTLYIHIWTCTFTTLYCLLLYLRDLIVVYTFVFITVVIVVYVYFTILNEYDYTISIQ